MKALGLLALVPVGVFAVFYYKQPLLDPLITAASSNNLSGITAALSSGANVNAATSDGRTALIHASMLGHKDAVLALLQRGADLDRQGNWGRTALIYAAIIHPKTAIELVDAGANVKLVDKHGATALNTATDPELKALLQSKQ